MLGESRPANDLLEEMLPVTARIQRTSIEARPGASTA
jgi:hypothetical protein